MKPYPVLFATRQGHARSIAEHVAATFQARGLPVEVVDARAVPVDFKLDRYAGALLAASVHGGRHEPETQRSVADHLTDLERLPSVFLSVSLSEAGAEDESAPPEKRREAANDVQRMIDAFLSETGWHPSKTLTVAGALMYSRYNFLMRFVMRRIAASGGAATGTSHDHVYTDRVALDRLLDELAETRGQVPRSPGLGGRCRPQLIVMTGINN